MMAFQGNDRSTRFSQRNRLAAPRISNSFRPLFVTQTGRKGYKSAKYCHSNGESYQHTPGPSKTGSCRKCHGCKTDS